MLFYSLLKMMVTVLCLLFNLLQFSQSEGEDKERIVNNASREHVFPTPLIMHLNESTAQLLMEDANSMFVSNTSIMDLARDNETLQLLLGYRERKRKMRLLTIQTEVLRKLGLTQGPNVTARFSTEERQSLVRSFDRTLTERDDNETSWDYIENEVAAIEL